MTDQQKRKQGRPPGTAGPYKTDGQKQLRRTVTMDDETWEHCIKQRGGAAVYLRNLIKKDREQAK